jgi:hypothetical protein
MFGHHFSQAVSKFGLDIPMFQIFLDAHVSSMPCKTFYNHLSESLPTFLYATFKKEMYRLFFDYPLLLNNGRKEWLLRKLACSF